MKKTTFAITAQTIGTLSISEALNNATFTPAGKKLPGFGAISAEIAEKLKEQGVTAVAVLDPSVATGFAIPALEKAGKFAGSVGAIAKQSEKSVVIAGIVKNTETSSQLIICQTNKHGGLDIGMIAATVTPSPEGELMTLKTLPKATYTARGKDPKTILTPVASGLTNATVVDTKGTVKAMPWVVGKMPHAAAVVDMSNDQFKTLSSFKKVELSVSDMQTLTQEVKATVGSPKQQTGTLVTAVAVEGEIICFPSENPTTAFKVPTVTEGTMTFIHG